MNIVFIMRHSGFVRIFESTLRLLCERGHRVHVAFLSSERQWQVDAPDIAQQLAAEFPRFSRGMAPERADAWASLGRELRGTLDYLRYLAPRYRNAPKLRARAARDVPEAVLRKTERGPYASGPGRAALAAWLRLMERSIPVSREIDAFLVEHNPDLLLVSPLVEPGSPQREYLRAARARGIRTVLCVASWDNLTNKGLIHGPVDLVTVWNTHMRQEAVELHGIAQDRVAVTGAQQFDHWFSWQPATSRTTFCARVGLVSADPYLLYLGSSKFVAPDEAAFVRQWLRQLRDSPSAALRRVGVVIRPHPQNEEQWRRFDAPGCANWTIYPRSGAVPLDAASKSDYFDSIYHSAAVVGVNTTAEIESAIVGRRVYTLLAPEFRDTQEGTLHFHYLREAGGGLVHEAHDFPEHLAQLDEALRAGVEQDAQCRRFVEVFVRPHGIEVEAASKLVDAIESASARPFASSHVSPRVMRLLQPALARRAARAERDARNRAEAKAAERHVKSQLAKEDKKRQRKAQKRRQAEAGEKV